MLREKRPHQITIQHTKDVSIDQLDNPFNNKSVVHKVTQLEQSDRDFAGMDCDCVSLVFFKELLFNAAFIDSLKNNRIFSTQNKRNTLSISTRSKQSVDKSKIQESLKRQLLQNEENSSVKSNILSKIFNKDYSVKNDGEVKSKADKNNDKYLLKVHKEKQYHNEWSRKRESSKQGFFFFVFDFQN